MGTAPADVDQAVTCGSPVIFGSASGSGWWGCGVSLLVITRGTSSSLVLGSLAGHRHVACGRV
jgi:hypothetical protein